jgi:hypothetical protein
MWHHLVQYIGTNVRQASSAYSSWSKNEPYGKQTTIQENKYLNYAYVKTKGMQWVCKRLLYKRVFLFYHEDGDSSDPRNTGLYPPNYMTSHHSTL